MLLHCGLKVNFELPSFSYFTVSKDLLSVAERDSQRTTPLDKNQTNHITSSSQTQKRLPKTSHNPNVEPRMLFLHTIAPSSNAAGIMCVYVPADGSEPYRRHINLINITGETGISYHFPDARQF